MYFKLNFNKNLVLMYAISLLQGMVFYGSVSTLYRQAVGVTLFQITLMESLSMVLTIVLEIPWGILADKIGYKRTFVICSFLFFVSKLVFLESETQLRRFPDKRILLAAVDFRFCPGVEHQCFIPALLREGDAQANLWIF
ncbi:MAG: MFS transporter [Mediterraneibacter gnavus]